MEGSCGLLGGKGKGEEETVLYKEILWTMEKEKIEEVKRKKAFGRGVGRRE